MSEGDIQEFKQSKQNPYADRQFKDWKDRYPDGYLLTHTESKEKVMLHSVGCLHFKNYNKEMNLTRNRKICSPSRQRLIAWTLENLGTKPKPCPDC